MPKATTLPTYRLYSSSNISIYTYIPFVTEILLRAHARILRASLRLLSNSSEITFEHVKGYMLHDLNRKESYYQPIWTKSESERIPICFAFSAASMRDFTFNF